MEIKASREKKRKERCCCDGDQRYGQLSTSWTCQKQKIIKSPPPYPGTHTQMLFPSRRSSSQSVCFPASRKSYSSRVWEIADELTANHAGYGTQVTNERCQKSRERKVRKDFYQRHRPAIGAAVYKSTDLQRTLIRLQACPFLRRTDRQPDAGREEHLLPLF